MIIPTLALVCLSVLSTAGNVTTEINLTQLELFEPDSLSIYKIKSNYLLCSAVPASKLQIVAKDGSLRFEYAKEGQGPGELKSPSVLTITDNEIYIHSIGVGVLIFDHQLNLLSKTQNAKRLKREFAMVRPFGLQTTKDRFLVFGHRFLDHHLFTFSTEDAIGKGIWEPRKSELKKYHPNQGIKEPEISSLHQNVVFTYQLKVPDNHDAYQVLVHQQHEGEWVIVAELTGAVDEIPSWLGNLKGVINKAFKIDGGFLIEFGGAHPTSKSMRDFTNYYDFFDEQGTFQRRVIKYNHRILPVHGSAELLELDSEGEEDILRTIDVRSLKPDL